MNTNNWKSFDLVVKTIDGTVVNVNMLGHNVKHAMKRLKQQFDDAGCRIFPSNPVERIGL